MSSSSIAADAPGGVLNRFWRRDLAAYPESARRSAYLGIVVLTTIVLY